MCLLRKSISSRLTAKSLGQAESDLKTETGAQDITIVIFPAFLSILPTRASQIHVIFKPVLANA